MLIVTDGGDAHAQGHDEGHRHGAGGDAAGIEGDGPEVRRDLGGKAEDDEVKEDQQPGEGDAEEDAQQGDDEKDADAQGHGPDDDVIGDGGHLLRPDLQVRLRHGDEHANEEAQEHDDGDLPGGGDLLAHVLAQGDHGHLGAQGEKAHAEDQQDAAHEERHHGVVGDGGQGEAEQGDDAHDGQNGDQGLPQGLAEDGEEAGWQPGGQERLGTGRMRQMGTLLKCGISAARRGEVYLSTYILPQGGKGGQVKEQLTMQTIS